MRPHRPRVALPVCYQPRSNGSVPLLAVEGVSGCGKSTLVQALADRLDGHSLHTIPKPLSDLSAHVNATGTPLSRLVFYLAGALAAGDLVREADPGTVVVADRWCGSVLANHAAVHRLPLTDVQAVAAPYLATLPRPKLTVYLEVGDTELQRRLADKPDLSESDQYLINHPDALERLRENYHRLAALDPLAIALPTDGRTSQQLADTVLTVWRERHAPAD